MGIDPGTFDSSSQYSIHWTSLTQDAGEKISVPFHTAFLLKEKSQMRWELNLGPQAPKISTLSI